MLPGRQGHAASAEYGRDIAAMGAVLAVTHLRCMC